MIVGRYLIWVCGARGPCRGHDSAGNRVNMVSLRASRPLATQIVTRMARIVFSDL